MNMKTHPFRLRRAAGVPFLLRTVRRMARRAKWNWAARGGE